MNGDGSHGDTRPLRYGDRICKGDRGRGGRADPPHVRHDLGGCHRLSLIEQQMVCTSRIVEGGCISVMEVIV